MKRFSLFGAAVGLFCATLMSSAFAATKTWSCPTASGNWSNGANWGGTAPAAGDTLVFNCAVTSNADLSSGTRIAAVILGANSGGSIINGAIQFNSALAAASNVEDNANDATNTINATIQLANGRSWFKSSVVGHTLEFKGTISGIGTGGAVPVENGIRIYGPGTVKFNHNTDNTYIGDTTVHSADGNGANGSLQLAGNAFNVIPGNFIVGTSTTASNAANRPQARLLASQVIADGSKVTVGPDGLLALEAGETIGQLLGTGGVNIINPLGTLTIGDAGDFTWGGVISGAGNLNKVGTGTLRLAGTTASTYGGSTTIERGILELAKSGGVTAITGPIVIGNNTDPAGSATLRNLASDQFGGKPLVTINSSGVYDMNSTGLIEYREWIGGLSGTGLLLIPGFSNLIIEIPSGSATFGGTLNSQTSTTSLIQKRGVGEQIFTGNGSAYVGGASVALGRLTVNSPGVLGSHVEIDNGGELGGTGGIGRLTVYDGGRVRPGNGSGGTLTAVGPTVFNSGSTLVIDLGGASPARYRGVLDVAGTLTLGSGAKLSLQPAFSDPIAPTFDPVIVDFFSIVGAFQNLPEGAMISGGPYNFQITYSCGVGNSICLTSRNTLDIDGDGKYLAETDGLLIARYLSNPANAALTANAVATANGAQRVSHTDILGYLNRVASTLDIDQSGARDTTDSLLITRWLFGFRGEGLVAGIATPVGVTRARFISFVELALRTASP
jgi:autotransporter-associated beta strand protein